MDLHERHDPLLAIKDPCLCSTSELPQSELALGKMQRDHGSAWEIWQTQMALEMGAPICSFAACMVDDSYLKQEHVQVPRGRDVGQVTYSNEVGWIGLAMRELLNVNVVDIADSEFPL